MRISDYLTILGCGFLFVALLFVIVWAAYSSLRKRAIEVNCLAMVMAFGSYFLVWLFTKDYGSGPDNPVPWIVALVAIPISAIIVGISFSLLAHFLARVRMKK